jgi:hypothetical protein
MVGHQDIGVDGHIRLQRQLAQFGAILLVVGFGEEARLAIVPELDHVLGDTGQIDAGLAGHGAPVLTGEGPRLPPPPIGVDRNSSPLPLG